MPELPEVETIVRGISPEILGKTIVAAKVREHRLRWPVPPSLESCVAGQKVKSVKRRAKYILIAVENGHVLIHLGMSGTLQLVKSNRPPQRHDHVDFVMSDGRALRFRDPRKFGCVLWINGQTSEFRLLASLGPEPLSNSFTGEYLHAIGKNRKTAIKNLVMDSKVVVGVGNIYASEALFRAGIHPLRKAGRISLQRYSSLVSCIQTTLNDALVAGGTTLRDFVNGDGQPGYFSQDLAVYDRERQPCLQCGSAIRRVAIGQRSTYYCTKCQR